MLGSPSLEEFTGIVTTAGALLRLGRGVREADRGSCAWGEVNKEQSESQDTVGGRRVTLMLLGGRRRMLEGGRVTAACPWVSWRTIGVPRSKK